MSPLILRPYADGFAHQIVGIYYLDRIITGEALLGELPKGWAQVQKYYPDLIADYVSFVDGNTGKTQTEDPRLGPLRPGWRVAAHEEDSAWDSFTNVETGEDTNFDPRLELEMLKARGVDIQEFVLI